MRTNRNGVTEVASLRTDIEKYDSNFEDIFTKDWSVTYQVNGYAASDSITVRASSEIAAKKAASERISELMAMSGEHASFEILFVKPGEKVIRHEDMVKLTPALEAASGDIRKLEKEKGIEIKSASNGAGGFAELAVDRQNLDGQSLDDLRRDAMRWRAFIGSHYIKMWGSGQLGNSKNQHVGFEIWDVLPPGYMSEESLEKDKSSKEQILTYVDTIIKRGLK